MGSVQKENMGPFLKMMKNFKMVTTEHEAKHGSFWLVVNARDMTGNKTDKCLVLRKFVFCVCGCRYRKD